MDLKNIKFENIKLEDIKGKIIAIADKKTLIKFGIGFGSIILFLIIYYAIINPIVKDKRARIDTMMNLISESKQFEMDIELYAKTIKKLTPEYKKHSRLFHSRKEVEGLYDSLSRFAAINGLVISKIEKRKPKAVMKAGVGAKTSDKKNKKNIAYYIIPVNFEIEGNFLNYIKFKRDISRSKKLLNFDKESIAIIKSNTTGAISAKGLLTIVGLTDEFF